MEGQEKRNVIKQACADWLESVMNRLSLKPSAVAERMGCSLSTVSKMQNRKETRIITFEEAYRFSGQSGIPLEEIAYEIFGPLETEDIQKISKKKGPAAHRRNKGPIERFLSMSPEEQELAIRIYDTIKNFMESKDHGS